MSFFVLTLPFFFLPCAALEGQAAAAAAAAAAVVGGSASVGAGVSGRPGSRPGSRPSSRGPQRGEAAAALLVELQRQVRVCVCGGTVACVFVCVLSCRCGHTWVKHLLHSTFILSNRFTRLVPFVQAQLLTSSHFTRPSSIRSSSSVRTLHTCKQSQKHTLSNFTRPSSIRSSSPVRTLHTCKQSQKHTATVSKRPFSLHSATSS